MFLSILGFFKNNKDRILSKDTFYVAIIVGLIIMLLLKGCEGNNKDAMTDSLKKEIVAKDKIYQEQNGSYHKLVNTFNSERDLKEELRIQNVNILETVKAQNEKILSLTNAMITFATKTDNNIPVTVTKDQTGKDVLNFVTRYPDKIGEPNFITYTGNIRTSDEKLSGEWTFDKLKFAVILTEQKDGLWATRIKGPDFLKVDSITVNSLPKEQIASTKNFFLLAGGGVKTELGMSNVIIGLNGGIEYKKNIGYLELNTNKVVGLTYLRKF